MPKYIEHKCCHREYYCYQLRKVCKFISSVSIDNVNLPFHIFLTFNPAIWLDFSYTRIQVN